MAISGLDHFTINTVDLSATERFYEDVIGMTKVPRPDLGFPGAWLGACEGGAPIVHIMAMEGWAPAYESGRDRVDHLALHGQDFDKVLERIKAFDLPWVGNVIADFGLWQLMVYDPNGVLVELNFKARDEACPTPVIPSQNQMGGAFAFEPSAYARFGG